MKAKVLNRAAEDAVKEATPIFVDAVTKMSFADGTGNKTSCNYSTWKFNPVIKNSFESSVLTKYGQTLLLNTIAFR
jgi:hypothetical protein